MVHPHLRRADALSPRGRERTRGPARAGSARTYTGGNRSLRNGVGVASSWSSRREVSPETTRLLIERAHEELLAGNAADSRLDDVRPLVRDSWRRSLQGLVGAEDLPPLDLDAETLGQRLQCEHGTLLHEAFAQAPMLGACRRGRRLFQEIGPDELRQQQWDLRPDDHRRQHQQHRHEHDHRVLERVA